MYQLSGSTQAALDYNSTIIGALELSEKKWCSQFNCLELAGIRDMCWKLAVRGWLLLSSV
jgi:hypothetical protein